MPAWNRLRRQVILRLVWTKLKRAPVNAALAAALPLIILALWIKGGFEPAARAFLLLLPHALLFLSQDMVRDELRSGALENVLFLQKGFKSYLLEKNAVLILAGTVYAVLLFGPLWAYGLISRTLGHEFLLGFLASLLAGIYYVGINGLLSHFFKGVSNALLVIAAQAGALTALALSAAHQGGFFECFEKGTFPGFAAKAKFLALTAVLPNIVSIARIRRSWPFLALLVLAVFLVQWLRVRILQLERT